MAVPCDTVLTEAASTAACVDVWMKSVGTPGDARRAYRLRQLRSGALGRVRRQDALRDFLEAVEERDRSVEVGQQVALEAIK